MNRSTHLNENGDRKCDVATKDTYTTGDARQVSGIGGSFDRRAFDIEEV